MDCIAFVNRIDERLTEMNINRAKMIRDCELSESCMRAWKRGVLPNVDFVYRVAKYLGVSVEYLLTGVKDSLTTEQPVKFVASPEEPKLKKDESELLEHYRKLKANNQYLIMMMIRELDSENVTNNVTK